MIQVFINRRFSDDVGDVVGNIVVNVEVVNNQLLEWCINPLVREQEADDAYYVVSVNVYTEAKKWEVLSSTRTNDYAQLQSLYLRWRCISEELKSRDRSGGS